MNNIRLRKEDIIDESHMSEGIVLYLKSSGIHDIQRYHAGLRRFTPVSSLTINSGFKSAYESVSTAPENLDGRCWVGKWKHKRSGEVQTLKVFSKIVHLVDPILFQQRSQLLSYLPSPDASERDKLRRHAISRHNQASVDATVCYILSRLGELGLTPHSIQYLETICGVADKYKFKITDEIMTYRNQGWFWSLAEDGAQISFEGEFPENLKTWIKTPPKETDTDSEASSEVIEITAIAADSSQSEAAAIADLEECDVASVATETAEEPLQLVQLGEGSIKPSESDEMNDILDESKGDIYLSCPHIPVLVCFQEAAEGTMDSLMAELEENEDGVIGDREAEEKWSAWLFQIVAALSVYQKYVRFCHNDLHTNNIVYVNTDQEYLYYKSGDDIYKVPTFGKLFKLIDFGRATCEIGAKKIMSSDFGPEEDAAGQYNWGPFYDESLPEAAPNMSFDLCRLAVSLFESLCPDEEMREDSDLAQLLWEWMLDDEGQSVLYTDDGEERFPGFELYIHIAHNVHGAVPAQQFAKKALRRFKWKGKAARAAAVSESIRKYTIFADAAEDI